MAYFVLVVEMVGNAVEIKLYRWAGQWGPFLVKIPCGECALTLDVIKDTLARELAGIEVSLEVRDWLSCWWQPLLKGGWHAPIVMVDNRVVSQGAALNRGVLTQAVIDAHSQHRPLEGNRIFGKPGCPHCARAKAYLDQAGIDFTYEDVVASPRALYEMLARVKSIIGPTTPVTLPQIWLQGDYIGGADQLSARLHRMVEPNPERGQCSLSPSAPD
ncbi:hypothetical protein MIB92_14200 [Aestuariirhabdus sp. Z084]|uniref:glutaredoxin domain-containing protein n=1 Tax=Aestuariirhabdus haliotis TaxID=2918751 RepID=UPI00201B3B88|nr:glutaredoxin domain-containing protein [Aestuariirhabdus haliotis]MCL6416809.1 hypothetical protein [Aestuariirhabdus haliotis]MCL6420809.1 hypothetical protein [Aestuariirhabdus haliotis]